MEEQFNLERIIGFDALYESMYKCRRDVGWKDAVASYCLNGIENTLRMETQLKDGSYRPMPQRTIQITHPKPRTATSIAYRDRVYQRSLNDNAIYPAMCRSFIRHNVACQKGKGTDFARRELDRFLHEAYRKHGLDFYYLYIDIKGYYPNMPHWVAEECFRKHLPPNVYERAEAVLRTQYGGDVGYNPGSQMVQIAGISVLSPLDHHIKERLRVKWYMRYMDDLILIHGSKEFLEECLEEIKKELAKIGFHVHPDKSGVYPITDGIKTLGFTHRLTESGKVLHIINSENVKAERRKLYRMVEKAKRGEITKKKCDECFEAWKAHARFGNTYRLIQRMEQYYKGLWEGEKDNGTGYEERRRCA